MTYFFISLGIASNISTTDLFSLLFKLLQPPSNFSNSPMSSISVYGFKLAKRASLANFDVSTPAACFK